MFPISPRNSPAAIVHLLRQTSARHLFVTRIHLNPLISTINDKLRNTSGDFKLAVHEFPSIDEIYPKFANENFKDPFEPIKAPLPDVYKNGIVFYLHSSGSTGHPKAIPSTHNVIASQRHSRELRGIG